MDCSTFPQDHWGVLLPQLRKVLQRWPALSAAAAAAAYASKLQQQVVVCSRKGSDNTISQLADSTAALLAAPAPAPSAAAAAVASDEEDSADADGEGAAAVAGSEDGSAANTPAAAPTQPDAPSSSTAAAAAPDRLVLELGWETFKPRIMLDDDERAEEEDEEPVVEFALAIYNLQVRRNSQACQAWHHRRWLHRNSSLAPCIGVSCCRQPGDQLLRASPG